MTKEKFSKSMIMRLKPALVIVYVWIQNTSYAFAQTDTDKIENPIPSATSLSAFFSSIVDVLIQMGVVISALGIMYGGFQLVTAQGDEEKVASGRKTLTWAMVGTAVLLGAKVIFVAIKGTVEQLK